MQYNVPSVLNWLDKCKAIKAPSDWLEACLSWIQEENQGRVLGANAVQNAVYEQWLLSDLRELALGNLPPAVATEQRFVLKGRYTLQCESVRDVSSPYYGQLQKATGQENANTAVTAFTQPTQKPWEVKSKRMLMLQLTDGCVEVQGMEYESIPTLNVDITPGCKVLISGEMQCGLGVLMLRSSNITILGGEVESLISDNPHIQTMEKALNNNIGMIENPPALQHQEFSAAPRQEGSSARNTSAGSHPPTNQQTSSYQSYNSTSGANQKNITSNTSMEIPDDDLDILAASGGLESTLPTDDWDDDVDYDAVMTELDTGVNASNNSNAVQPQQRSVMSRTNVGVGPRIEARPQKSSSFPDGDEFEAMEQLHGQVLSGRVNRRSFSPDLDEMEAMEDMEIPSATKPLINQQSRDLYSHSVTDKLPLRPPSQHNPIKKEALSQPHRKEPPQNLNKSEPAPSKQKTMSSFLCKSEESSIFTYSDKSTTPSNDNYVKKARLESKKSEPLLNPMDIKIEQPMKIGTDSELTRRPWTYLIHCKNAFPWKTSTIVCVKAYISTLISKLNHNEGSYWSLTVKLNDGTSVMDAELSDAIMTEMIGTSAKEHISLRQRAKKEKHLREPLRKAISNFQNSLIALSCILEMRLEPGKNTPIILRRIKVSKSDILQLNSHFS